MSRFLLLLLCTIQALAGCTRRDPFAPPEGAPLPLDSAHTDVLLIALCTLRADRLGLYGHDRQTSPFIDELGARGVVFERNVAQAPWTRPSMGALMAGRWPRAMRLDNPGGRLSFSMKLADRHTLLAEALGAHGYAAVGAVANPNLKARFGFAQGFDHYFEPEHTYAEADGLPPRGGRIVDTLLDMEAQVPDDQRLYARAVMLDTHHEPRPSLAHSRRFRGQPAHLQRYDAAVRSVDDHVRRLVTELRARRPNLLVVLAADHGEGLRLPEHHGPEHGNHVYQTTVHTPLVFQHPSLPAAGRRVAGLSMNIDVHPTVLDLLGLPAEHVVDGRSLAPVLRGETRGTGHAAVFAETFFRKKHTSTVLDGEHQLIREYDGGGVGGGHTDRLFAAADWKAQRDLSARRPAQAAALAAQLTAWELLQARLSAEEPQAPEEDLDADTRRMLEQLGYIVPGEDLEPAAPAGATP